MHSSSIINPFAPANLIRLLVSINMATMASPTVTSEERSQNSDPDEEGAEEPYQPLCIIKFGKVYLYTIPSFEVITVQLRHAVVQR